MDTKKLLEVLDIYVVLIMLMVSQARISTFIKLYTLNICYLYKLYLKDNILEVNIKISEVLKK